MSTTNIQKDKGQILPKKKDEEKRSQTNNNVITKIKADTARCRLQEIGKVS